MSLMRRYRRETRVFPCMHMIEHMFDFCNYYIWDVLFREYNMMNGVKGDGSVRLISHYDVIRGIMHGRATASLTCMTGKAVHSCKPEGGG